jgi:peptidoglycan/xylan/chitin deacetylase (PgdA/CDA1 family)
LVAWLASIATGERIGVSVSGRVGVEALSEGEDPTGKPIIITFDDGYRDFLTALSSLQKYLFAATVFLVAARIGGFAEWVEELIIQIGEYGQEF